MDLTPAEFNFVEAVAGDTYPATRFDFEGTEADLVSVRCYFKRNGARCATVKPESGDGITILDTLAGQWSFDIDEMVVPPEGTYSYDLETTDELGTIRTWLSGTWVSLPEVTK